jgi:lipopolysaccharide heptosyltransferase II
VQAADATTTDLRPDRILIRSPNPLGDAVMAEPAIRAIAGRFPETRLDVQTPRALVPLGHAWRFVDAVLPVFAGSRALERLDRLWAPPRLRRRRFDLCVLFPNARGVADLAARAGIPRRFGYARDGREALLTDPVPAPGTPRDVHMVVYYWGLATAVGCGDVPVLATLDGVRPDEVPRILGRDSRTAPRIEPTDEMLEAARRVLRRAGLAGGPLVAVAPGAAHGSAKRWPAAHFGALCRRLARELGQPCALLGSADERALGAAVRQHAGPGSPLVDLTGRTDLGTLIGVLATASLFVGNDSGPAHVAAALGRPGVTLFGSTSEAHSGPVGPRMRTLHRHLPCSPCFARECPLGHFDCLNGLSVDDVARAARQALDGADS